MRKLTKEELNSEYLIYKDLTPDKNYKTFIAMKEHSDGSLYSVILKEMDKKRAEIYQSLSGMWNPYIADTYDVFQLTSSDSFEEERYIAVTEYVTAKGDLEEECFSLTQFVHRNGPLKESVALSICTQICESLKEFHKKGFVHRDLKPDNIMISKYNAEHPSVKIVDFGGAKEINFDKHVDTTVIGTLGYQPPESISSHTTNKSDIYSIGCILNFMLTGQEPGIQQYQNNHYIVSIIEKSTNEDSSCRYANVTALQKELEHELHIKPIDKIPLLRALPGFRTHTLWKEILAINFYLIFFAYIFLSAILPDVNGYANCLKMIGFYLPGLIMLFNFGNLLRFFPKQLRNNNRLFLVIRITIFVISIFVTSYLY